MMLDWRARPRDDVAEMFAMHSETEIAAAPEATSGREYRGDGRHAVEKSRHICPSERDIKS
jgi:hypothetical protein